MRLKGSYIVLAPKVEPYLIDSWGIWKIGKFCVLKGAVNLWCSAQRDSLKEECSRSIFHIWLLSPFTFSIVPPSNNVTSWKLSKEGFMSGRNSTEGKHLVDVIFHFSKFHKAICRSVDCEDLFWKTGRFYHICQGGKTQISHFSTLDGSEILRFSLTQNWHFVNILELNIEFEKCLVFKKNSPAKQKEIKHHRLFCERNYPKVVIYSER